MTETLSSKFPWEIGDDLSNKMSRADLVDNSFLRKTEIAKHFPDYRFALQKFAEVGFSHTVSKIHYVAIENGAWPNLQKAEFTPLLCLGTKDHCLQALSSTDPSRHFHASAANATSFNSVVMLWVKEEQYLAPPRYFKPTTYITVKKFRGLLFELGTSNAGSNPLDNQEQYSYQSRWFPPSVWNDYYNRAVDASNNRNEQLAFEFYWRGATKRNPDVDCISALASYYERGEIVGQSNEQAFNLYLKAANLGDKHSQFCVANAYFSGKSVPLSFDRALYWYIEAASGGNCEANRCLRHLKDENSLPPHLQKVVNMWFSAKFDNNPNAQYDLGCHYFFDPLWCSSERAAYWWGEASYRGHEKAKEALTKES